MRTITDETRRKLSEAGRKGGKIRAQQFTSEYQREVRAKRSSESCAEAGRKGARATYERHGLTVLQKHLREKGPTRPEQKVIEVLKALGVQYRYNVILTCAYRDFLVDLVIGGTHVIEVHGAVHDGGALFDPKGTRQAFDTWKVEQLRQSYYRVLVLHWTELGDTDQVRAKVREFLGLKEE